MVATRCLDLAMLRIVVIVVVVDYRNAQSQHRLQSSMLSWRVPLCVDVDPAQAQLRLID